MPQDEGPIYTRGQRYRARAEARQRRFRATVLGAEHGRYGHLLCKEAADRGLNFVSEEAFRAARARQAAGKGVAQRTFDNMLSSQAMCFNLFAPLASRLDLAAEVLRPFIEGLQSVSAIHLEYTPAGDLFGDQTGRGGVDCDVLIEGVTTRGRLVQVVETKFVEPEFSRCGFRKPGRARKGQEVCPEGVPLADDRRACLYARNKDYLYWSRTDEHAFLRDDAVPPQGCPFGDDRWQLWVNTALAYEEAARREAADVRFAVCASAQNTALLGGGALEHFRSLLRAPESVRLIDLDALLEHLGECVPSELSAWSDAMSERYAGV